MVLRLDQVWVKASRVPPELSGDALCRWFADRVQMLEGASVLLLWHQALVVSASRTAHWREFANEATASDLEQFRTGMGPKAWTEQEAESLILPMEAPRLGYRNMEQIVAWLTRPLEQGWAPVLRAMGLARAIDARWGNDLPKLFGTATGSPGPLRLRGGWPVPRAEPPLRAMMGGLPLSSRPDNLELGNLPRSHTNRLGLVSRRLGTASLRLHFADTNVRNWEAVPLRAAAAVVRGLVSHRVTPSKQSPGRFRVRVKGDVCVVAEALAAWVCTAAAQKASVLVMPELCSSRLIHHNLDMSIAARVQGGEPVPRLMVTGSRHVATRYGGKKRLRNRATLYVDGHAVFQHDKFNPVALPEPDGREHIDTQRPTLNIFFHPTFSVAIAVCKDILERTVRERLQDASPTFVLVPAWTPKAQPFELASAHLLLQQTITIVCNYVDDRTASVVPTAFVALPVEGPVHRVTLDGPSPAQGVWVCAVHQPVGASRPTWRCADR